MYNFVDALLINAWVRQRASRADQLGDRLLADIGVSRAELAQSPWLRRQLRGLRSS